MKKVKLNKLEEKIVSAILLETKSNIDKKLSMLDKKATFVKNEKNKQYIKESVAKLKKNINTVEFKDLVTNTIILQETTSQLLEKETPIYLIRYPDMPFVKKAKLEALEGDTTETVFLTFKIPFYPKNKSYMEVKRELHMLGRKLSAFGHTVINKILRSGKQNEQWPLFIGSGIWESNLPEFLNKREVLGSVELAIDTNSASMQELKPEVAKLLAAINETIPQFFGSSIEVQKNNNIEKNTFEDEDESIEDNSFEDNNIEKEPTTSELAATEKEFNLTEEAKILKEKIEKLTNKKIVFKNKK